MALRYDPLGRLYEVTGASGTTRFLYDGDALLAEYDAAGARQQLYVHAGGADTPFIWFTHADIRFLHTDHQGSIMAISSLVNGNVVGINAYDEYGIPGAGNVGRFQYTGQIWLAELGMYHYKARIYSPTLGRFLQTDPIGYEDQFNLYAYVGNDPVNSTDPSGTVICDTSKNAQCTEVHSAARAARAAALQARNDLSGLAGAIRAGTELTSDQQSILGTFERKFGAGSGTASNLNAAATHFDRVATSIGVEGAGLRARFRSDAYMGNAIASVRLNRSQINIGSRFFGPSMSAVRPFVVLHEAGHSLGLEDTILPGNAPQGIGHYSLGHIRGYGVRATDWLGANAPGQARINNDNYNCFAMPICGGL